MNDSQYATLVPLYLRDANERGHAGSASGFRRWLEANGYPSIGSSRAERILQMVTPRRVRVNRWQTFSQERGVVDLQQSRVDYDIGSVDVRSAIREFIRSGVTPVKIKTPTERGYMVGVLSIPDIHVGKLAWGQEVGENYDSEIAERAYVGAASELIGELIASGAGHVIYIVGNDLLHVDGPDNQTTAGTPQDTDTRWQYAFRRAKRMVVSTIEALGQHVSVDVIVAPGNHDKVLSWALGEVVSAYFKDTDHINVDNSPAHRKYVRRDNLLFGVTHGDGIKPQMLPSLMATEVPEWWGQTRWREWYLGHYHKKNELVTVGVDDHSGVRIRYAPSLAGIDRWHYEKGYRSVRSAEAHVYDPRSGELVASYYAYPRG